MNVSADYTSFVALIDDDVHSAHLMTRALLVQGASSVQHYGDAVSARARLQTDLGKASPEQPGLIVVDLKAHSGANLEFLIAVQQLTRASGVPVVVLAPRLGEQSRHALLENGAAAVFVRHAERDAYHRVAADIVELWALTQRPEAVGM